MWNGQNTVCLEINVFWIAKLAFVSKRTVLQKNGGRLGESGSTTHLFYNCGGLHIDKKKCSEEEIFEMATNSGAKDCFNLDNHHEIISEKEDFYKVKSEFEKKLDNFQYSGIEWRPLSYLDLNKEQSEKIIEILESLEELDDVQNIYTNANLGNIDLWKL